MLEHMRETLSYCRGERISEKLPIKVKQNYQCPYTCLWHLPRQYDRVSFSFRAIQFREQHYLALLFV